MALTLLPLFRGPFDSENVQPSVSFSLADRAHSNSRISTEATLTRPARGASPDKRRSTKRATEDSRLLVRFRLVTFQGHRERNRAGQWKYTRPFCCNVLRSLVTSAALNG